MKLKIINKIDQSMIKNKDVICILIRLNIALIAHGGYVDGYVRSFKDKSSVYIFQ